MRRAWLSPRGVVHPLPDLGTHHRWVEKNKKLTGGKSVEGLLQSGWVRKHQPDMYEVGAKHEEDRTGLAKVRAHVKKHHPKHLDDNYGVEVFVKHPNGTDTYMLHHDDDPRGGEEFVERRPHTESRADVLILAALREGYFRGSKLHEGVAA